MNFPNIDWEEYPQVKKNIEEYINEAIKEEHQKQLEEWTGLKCSDILFNSNIDYWSKEISVLNERIIGKKQITLIIEDMNGNIFGCYLNARTNVYFHIFNFSKKFKRKSMKKK